MKYKVLYLLVYDYETVWSPSALTENDNHLATMDMQY